MGWWLVAGAGSGLRAGPAGGAFVVQGWGWRALAVTPQGPREHAEPKVKAHFKRNYIWCLFLKKSALGVLLEAQLL